MGRAKKFQMEGLKNVIALGFVSLFTDISSEMSFSIWPIFILEELDKGNFRPHRGIGRGN